METYVGIIRSPSDAIALFEACRLGLLPRVCRRLSEKERQSIKSGSVFVWDEREAGMRRWTDGKSWSASRVSGSFLTYREMEGKRSGPNNPFNQPPGRSGRTPEAGGRNSDEGDQGTNDESQDGYRYKPDGLMKQSFSITTSAGQHLHLISYYSRLPAAQAQLKTPTNDPALRNIKPAPGMYPESSVQDSQSMPALSRSPMPHPGLPNQPPRGPGYVKAFLGPQAHHPQYPGGPPLPPGSPYVSGPPPAGPPQLGPNGYGQPVYGLPQHASQPPGPAGYFPGPPVVPPAHLGMAKENVAPYGYRPSELPPISGYSHGPSPTLVPPRNSTPPSDVGRPPHHRTGSAGSYQQSYYPSPHTHYNTLTPQASISSHPSQNNSPSSTPPVTSLDPRGAIAPSPLSQHSPRSLHPDYGTSSQRRSLSPHRTPPTSYPPQMNQAPPKLPQINPPSSAAQPSAGTIPSIGALVNGAEAYERNRDRSRSNSRSPSSNHPSQTGEGASPAAQWNRDKLDFGEDRRALNVLNKAFRT